MITNKNWNEKKIRVNLDTRPMTAAVSTSHFPIPTPQELRHNILDSDRFSIVYLNHAFHQFEQDEKARICLHCMAQITRYVDLTAS